MSFFLILLIVYGIGSAININSKDNANNQSAIGILILILPMFALCAFRALSIGNDTEIYYYGFNRIHFCETLSIAIQKSRYEVGYTILCYLVDRIGLSFQSLQIIISAFVYGSFYLFFKKYSKNYWLSCYIFLTLRFLMSTMNVVRMWIAIAILLFSVTHIQNRNLIKFAVIVLIASCFHLSALVFLLIYPLVKLKVNFKTIYISIVTSAALFVVGRPVFIKLTEWIGRYGGYLNSNYFNYESNVAVYLTLAINLSLFYLIYKNKNISVNNKESTSDTKTIVSIEQISLVSGLLVMSFSIIGLGNTIMDRVSAYFNVFFTISLPMVFYKKKNDCDMAVLLWGLMIALAAQFLVVMIYRPSWNGVTPYYFYWE